MKALLRPRSFVILLLLAALAAIALANHYWQSDLKRTELSGGEASIRNRSRLAYSLSITNLSPELMEDFSFGNRLFNTNWVQAPSSTASFDGLGPLFNRVSCSACHLRDGRGRPPAKADEMMESMLIRLSVPGMNEHGGPLPHPRYGDQLQDRAIGGVKPKGYATVSYEEIPGSYADGTPYSLRKPTYRFHNLTLGELGEDTLISPRVAPAVFGLGLLEAVPAEYLEQLAEKQRSHPDGISGRPNYVWDIEKGARVLGRFGWKANQPSLRQQDASAFHGDIGITSTMHPAQNCMAAQKDCQEAATGGAPEIPEEFLSRIVRYSRTLAVPVARDMADAQVIHGEVLFVQAQCSACHVPVMRTGRSDIPQLSNQLIHPFTDLLLHDMGEGLADNRPDFEATGREWRTPPLWGIGLQETVNGHTALLHDGRARGLEEAILWHGGEAEASRERFRAMKQEDREALLKFLRSL